MSIEVQIQLIVMSVLFGFIFMTIYSFFNELLFKNKLRILIEIPLFLIGTIIYFYLIYFINGGLLNIYMFLFLLFGVLIYQMFYSKFFLCIYANIHKKIILFFNKHVIIKKKKVRKYGKKRSTTRVRLEQKQSNHNVTTWHIDSPSSLRR